MASKDVALGDQAKGATMSRSLEAYRKQIAETRVSLGKVVAGDQATTTGDDVEKPADADSQTPATPDPVPVPANPRAPPQRRPSFTSPVPPPPNPETSGAESVSAKPPPMRSPRASFRRSSVKALAVSTLLSVPATPLTPTPFAAGKGAPPKEEKAKEGGEAEAPKVEERSKEPAASKPEPSPRTKAKELIGQTLENLRRRAKPFTSASSSGKTASKTEVKAPTLHLQSATKGGEGVRLAPASTSRIDSSKSGPPRGGGGRNPTIGRLLKDASLLHKKVDALVERDQNVKPNPALDAAGPKTQLADRLYHSISKLRTLERSRNKMTLCAEGMEASVRSLSKFADQLSAERRREETLDEERKARAQNVIDTNASLLTTEIALLLRSYAVEKRQIDKVKTSMHDFLDLVSSAIRDL